MFDAGAQTTKDKQTYQINGVQMGHTRYQDLKDLEKELSYIRKLDRIQEKKPGVFYLKSQAFLHFHDKDGIRWADVKENGKWKKLEINFKATQKQKKEFLKKVLSSYQLN